MSALYPFPQAKLSILLATLLVACYCYWLMERRLANKVPYRLPRIPRPRHKVTGPSLSHMILNFINTMQEGNQVPLKLNAKILAFSAS